MIGHERNHTKLVLGRANRGRRGCRPLDPFFQIEEAPASGAPSPAFELDRRALIPTTKHPSERTHQGKSRRPIDLHDMAGEDYGHFYDVSL